jgi:hypothetical protein
MWASWRLPVSLAALLRAFVGSAGGTCHSMDVAHTCLPHCLGLNPRACAAVAAAVAHQLGTMETFPHHPDSLARLLWLLWITFLLYYGIIKMAHCGRFACKIAEGVYGFC